MPWEATRKLKRPITHTGNYDGRGWAKSNKQRADLSADHLENPFQPNEATIERDLVENQGEDVENIKLVTSKEVADELEHISTRKST